MDYVEGIREEYMIPNVFFTSQFPLAKWCGTEAGGRQDFSLEELFWQAKELSVVRSYSP